MWGRSGSLRASGEEQECKERGEERRGGEGKGVEESCDWSKVAIPMDILSLVRGCVDVSTAALCSVGQAAEMSMVSLKVTFSPSPLVPPLPSLPLPPLRVTLCSQPSSQESKMTAD